MRTILLLVVTLNACRWTQGPPCADTFQIVSVGDPIRLEVGQIVANSDCLDLGKVAGFAWSSNDRTLESRGANAMRAVAPGNFRVVGHRGKEELAINGLVLPAGWTIKIDPAQVKARPQETVAFRVQAIAPTGTAMKDVPFAIFPQEFERLPPESKVIGPRARFGANEAVEFTAIAPGETTMIATIGQKRATARVVVEDPPPSAAAQPDIAGGPGPRLRSEPGR